MWRWEQEHGLWQTFRPVKGSVHHQTVLISPLKGEQFYLDRTDGQIEIQQGEAGIRTGFIWTFRPVKGLVYYQTVPISLSKGEQLYFDRTDGQIEIWDAGNKNGIYGELSALLKGQFINRQSPFHYIKGTVSSIRQDGRPNRNVERWEQERIMAHFPPS